MIEDDMTATWAAKVLEGVPRHADSQGYEPEYILEADALAAIARMGATDGLVERATAALKGVTDGPWFPGGVNGGGRPTLVYSDDATGSAVADTVLQFVRRGEGEAEANARFIAFTRQWVPEAAAQIAALTTQNQTWQRNSRETFDAMVAMRNSINEYLPMPSLESDLLQGPENSVFCAAVADAVVQRIVALTAERDDAVIKRAAWEFSARQMETERDTLRERVARLEGR